MLNLPMDPRAIAFEAIDRRLRTDPVISRIIRSFEGIPFELSPETGSKLPMMVIGVKPGGIQTATPNSHVCQLSIGMDYILPGVDHRDILNFYGALEQAIDPYGDTAWLRDPIAATNRATLYGQPELVQQGFSVTPFPSFNALGASAVLQISIKIRPERCS